MRYLRSTLILVLLLTFNACTELQQVVNQLPTGTPIGNDQIAQGLRQALDKGINEQVSRLTKPDGF